MTHHSHTVSTCSTNSWLLGTEVTDLLLDSSNDLAKATKLTHQASQQMHQKASQPQTSNTPHLPFTTMRHMPMSGVQCLDLHLSHPVSARARALPRHCTHTHTMCAVHAPVAKVSYYKRLEELSWQPTHKVFFSGRLQGRCQHCSLHSQP